MSRWSMSLDGAGFALPNPRGPWRRFVEDGDLGRELVRMCVLGGRALPLTFELGRTLTDGVTVRFGLRRATFTVAVEKAALQHDAQHGLGVLLRGLNQALARRRARHRFIIRLAPGGWRVVLTDPATAAHAAVEDWSAALSVEPNASAKPRVGEPAALPSVEERLPQERQLLPGASYPALLAAHAERLAAFAGAGQLRCEPAGPAFDGDGTFSLKLTWTYENGGSLGDTRRIRTRPRVQLQPLFDAINSQLRSARRPHLLYRCASSDGGEHAVLATPSEAALLRNAAQLIEGTLDQPALARLGDAGFALPYTSGLWKGFVYGDLGTSALGRCLTRACVLARPRRLSFTLGRDARGVRLQWRLDKKSVAHTYPADAPEVLPVLVQVWRDLNRLLASRRVSERFVIMTGESTWHAPRLLFLDPEWLDLVQDAPDTLLDCLPPEDTASPGRLPAARHPPRLPKASLARLPLVREIVEPRRVREDDFKCPARSTDFPELVESIAAFAKLRVACEPTATLTRRYKVYATFEGKPSVVELRDEKYADVGPIVTYVNGLLAKQRRPHRLYQFDAGAFDSGVLLASREEQEALRDAAYLQEGTPSAAALAHAIATGDIARAARLVRGGEIEQLDETLVGLGQLARTRANVARVLAALGPRAETSECLSSPRGQRRACRTPRTCHPCRCWTRPGARPCGGPRPSGCSRRGARRC